MDPSFAAVGACPGVSPSRGGKGRGRAFRTHLVQVKFFHRLELLPIRLHVA